MTACTVPMFPLRDWVRLTNYFTSSAQIISAVLLGSAPWSSGIAIIGGIMSSANREAKSSEYFNIFLTCPSSAATILAYCLRSICSSKHSNTFPFILAVPPLKFVPQLLLGSPRLCPRPTRFLRLPPRPLPPAPWPVPDVPERLLLVVSDVRVLMFIGSFLTGISCLRCLVLARSSLRCRSPGGFVLA